MILIKSRSTTLLAHLLLSNKTISQLLRIYTFDPQKIKTTLKQTVIAFKVSRLINYTRK
jgi:hypothetical protein